MPNDMREKLIEKLETTFAEQYEKRGLLTAPHTADYLLANGVIAPPCKVGDIVYYIFEGEIRELTVISLSYMFSENIKHFNLHTTNYRGAVLSYEIKDIDKTVFLTKEEAEKALKERESNG